MEGGAIGMKKKEKSLAELNSNKLIELKDKVKKLPLKEAEKMVRELDKDRDRYIFFSDPHNDKGE